MNKSELVIAVSDRTGLPRHEVREIVDSVFGIITESLTGGDKVTIAGFGSFIASEKQPRLGVNPRTMERIEIPAHVAVRFKPGNELADSLKNEYSDEE